MEPDPDRILIRKGSPSHREPIRPFQAAVCSDHSLHALETQENGVCGKPPLPHADISIAQAPSKPHQFLAESPPLKKQVVLATQPEDKTSDGRPRFRVGPNLVAEVSKGPGFIERPDGVAFAPAESDRSQQAIDVPRLSSFSADSSA